ncbi:MAG: MMPL family transporter [Phycisphaerales bacterium]|nr:MMPL family transporter [Phycisphaerales bacterium]
MHERVRDELLGWLGRFVIRRRVPVLLAALLLVAGSVWLALARLTMQTDRSFLVSPDLTWNAAYLAYKEEFPRWGDVIIAVDRGPRARRAQSPEFDRAAMFVRSLAQRLRDDPAVLDVLDGYTFRPQFARLMLTLPEGAYERSLAEFRSSRVVLESTSIVDLLRATLTGLSRAAQPASATGSLEGLSNLLRSIDRAMDDPAAPLFASAGGWRPLESDSGRYLLLSAALRREGASVSGLSEGIAAIRRHMAELQSTRLFAGIEAAVTGVGAIENDETAQSMADSTFTSVLAFALIALLLVIVFRGVVVPICAALTLLSAVAWSFGWATLVVGHLQVLSVVFTVILLGLGIDFALHLTARLELTREEHEDLGDVLSRVYRGIGPGIITGAVTTAASFAVMLLTDFKGVAEMGAIAAGGILLCLIAMLSVYPALLSLRPDWRKSVRHRLGGEDAHFAHGRLDVVDRRPRTVLIIALLLVAAAIPAALRTRYDPNLLNLHPPGVESVIWEHRLTEDSRRSAWIGISIVDSLEQAQRQTLALLQHDEIAAVEGVGSLFHPEREQRREAFVQDMPRDIPSSTDSTAPQAAQLIAQVRGGIEAAAGGDIETGETLDPALREALTQVLAASDDLLERLRGPDAESHWANVAQAWRRDRQTLIETWQAVADPRPQTLDDLPLPLRTLNISPDGRLLLRIQPADRGGSVLDPDRLRAFVSAMRAVDADVLGPAVQIYESTTLISRAYTIATCLAVAAILILLLLDFRSLADSLLALLPVVVGFIGLFAVMGVTDLPLNFANIIVMPFIFGIGVDAGVHIVHRWRDDPTGVPRGLSGGTGRGILLTTLTTVIGFGCMALAQHRGIRGLGITMVIGLTITLIACYTVLPAILRLRTAAEDVHR